MKKITFSLLVVFLFTTIAVPVFAEENATPKRSIVPILKEKLERRIPKIASKAAERVEKIENRIEGLDKVRSGLVLRVRHATGVRWGVLNKAIERSEDLLAKLQIRIEKAKAAGKDVTEAESLMVDAKKSLEDAKAKLEDIESKKDEAINKETFLEIQTQFKAINQNLHTIRINASKIIRILKGFNSATSSGNNPQATTSASDSE